MLDVHKLDALTKEEREVLSVRNSVTFGLMSPQGALDAKQSLRPLIDA